MHAIFGERRPEAVGAFGRRIGVGRIKRPPMRWCCDYESPRLRTMRRVALAGVIDDAVDLGDVAEEIVHPGRIGEGSGSCLPPERTAARRSAR